MKLGTPGFVGARLKEAREARGITAIALSEMLGVTRAAVSQYEGSEQSPRPQVMEKICSVLNVPAAFFLRPVSQEISGVIFYRSLSGATKQSRTRIESRMRWVHRIVDVVREYVELPKSHFPEFNLPRDPSHLTQDDIEETASEARSYWNMGDGPLGSIVNLLENNGAIISRDDFLVDEVDALSQWRDSDHIPYFLLNNRKQSAARSRMDLCHEIGHAILHRHLSKEELANPVVHRTVEDQAFRFAGAFALPTQSFTSELEAGSLSLDFFHQLKPTWKMSIGMMIKRTENLGLLTEEQAERLWINRIRRGWRVREPLDDELPVESPRLLPKAVHMAIDSKHVSRDAFSFACGYSTNDIEVLCGLERGFLSDPEATPRVLPFRDSSRKTI